MYISLFSVLIYHKVEMFEKQFSSIVMEELRHTSALRVISKNQSFQLSACLVKEVIKVIRLFILSPSNGKFMFLISLNLEGN